MRLTLGWRHGWPQVPREVNQALRSVSASISLSGKEIHRREHAGDRLRPVPPVAEGLRRTHYLRPGDMLLVLALPPLWWAASGLDQENAAWLHERL
jgi:hypothetical protein